MSKLIVITGCSSGIGHQLCVDFLKDADNIVVGIDIQEPTIENDLFTFYKCDLSNLTKTHSTAKRIEKQFGSVDVLINNAGKLDNYQSLLDVDYSDMYESLIVNLFSHMTLTKSLLPGMVEKRKGCIVNVTSVVSTETGGGGASYTSAKHGLLGFTKQLAVEVAEYGIRVNSVSPGAIRTPMTENDFSEESNMLWQDVQKTIPLDRWGTVEEVSNAVKFLTSDQNTYMQGHNLVIDGGWSINHSM